MFNSNLFSLIHSCINYGDSAWTSATPTKIENFFLKQTHAARINFHADRQPHTRPLLTDIKTLKTLNTYQVNIQPILNFIAKS